MSCSLAPLLAVIGGLLSYGMWLAWLGLAYAVGFIAASRLYCAWRRRGEAHRPVVAFFHPYCNAGGGGERVLWCAIRALQKRYPEASIVVYGGEAGVSSTEIAHRRFGISIQLPVSIVHLCLRSLLSPTLYPRFTLLGQALGSLPVVAEAVFRRPPDIFVDSTGHAFGLPLAFALSGACTACYVHYPTVTTEMVEAVASGILAHNNAEVVAQSAVLTRLKLIYYRAFAQAYGLAGSAATIVMANSSWTQAHLATLWSGAVPPRLVFPPCDVASFLDLPLERPREMGWQDGNERVEIVSIGQFRPEKNHELQLRAFRYFLDGLGPLQYNNVTLVLIGGCRGPEDEKRLGSLRALVVSLDLTNHVDFQVNVDFSTLRQLLAGASVGLHTMWNEHFGIGVVECMAAGAIVLAHNSGGPRLDIVLSDDDDDDVDEEENEMSEGSIHGERCSQGQITSVVHEADLIRQEGFKQRENTGGSMFKSTDGFGLGESTHVQGPRKMRTSISRGPTGFLASDEQSFASALARIFNLTRAERMSLRRRARRRALRFSDDCFETTFLEAFSQLMEP
uniref:GDP-Man:Man(3)GlcNAc(2)-PP-Dol alpha-1,2-mannosyltransferase n=1 Tax=Myxine glutinosa TaxID=7769 RepID=UPI0035900A2B